MQLIALQRNESARSTFVSEVRLYKDHFMIYVDETGCDRRNALRKYAYSVRGRPAQCQKLLVRGERISVVAAMTIQGILDLKLVRETVKGDDFVNFVENQLLPNLMNFDGHNSNSVVIPDNCSVHMCLEYVMQLEVWELWSTSFLPIARIIIRLSYCFPK